MCLDDSQGVLSWNVGRMLARAGAYAAARALFLQALQRQSEDPKSPELAGLRARIARSFAGVFVEEALQRCNPALMAAAVVATMDALEEMEALNMSPEEIAAACNNAGAGTVGMKRFNEAEALFMRALRGYEGVVSHGRLHEDTIKTLNNLGYALVKQGKFGVARSKLEDALERVQEAVLDGTRTHAVILDTMAQLLEAEGRLTDALKYYQDSLTMKQKVLPPSHEMITNTKQRLLNLKEQLKNLPQASRSANEHPQSPLPTAEAMQASAVQA